MKQNLNIIVNFSIINGSDVYICASCFENIKIQLYKIKTVITEYRN